MESLENRLTPAITANVVSSSLSSTSDPNVTIGEIVRMRVVVPEPLAGNFDPTAFNVQGTLPAGLQYLAGTADMALVSQNGIISTLDPTGANGLSVTGVPVSNVTPTFSVPSSAITTNNGTVTFNTGIQHANDDGSVTDYVVIEFNALVGNVATNHAVPPTSLTSSFMVFIGGTTCNCQGFDTLNVVEPSITNLNKTAQVAADGNSATYTLTFSNTGASTAYDVQVVDNLPAGLTLDPASVQVVGGTGLVNMSTATGLNLSFDSIAPGGAVTITYTAAIPAADQNGQPITNTVNLDYTSLPGPNGTNPNPTGSVTPGTSGSPTGERNGSGGINDYFDSASATITVQAPPAHPDSLAGFVFVDENHSGDYDAGDLLLPGAIITLEDANGNPVTDINGNVVGPQTTGANGAYDFTNLKDGTYEILESFANAAADNLMNGNIFPGLLNGVQDTTAQVDINARTITDVVLSGGGVNGTEYRFGYCPCNSVSINGFVYLDSNQNCQKDSSEPGLAGAVMELRDLNGNPVKDIFGNPVVDVTTDANGFYQFSLVPAGSYEVVELPPQPTFQGQLTLMECNQPGTVNGVTVGFAPVGSDLITDIALTAGQHSINNNFGKVLPSNVGAITLSGNVYFDANRDKVLDAGDGPVSGARLHLFRTDLPGGPVQIAQTTTNEKGQYLFEIDTAGTYMVTLDNVPGFIKEVANVGTVNGRLEGNAPTIDDLNGIVLVDGDSGVNYNFGLIANGPPPLSKQQLLANTPGGGTSTGVGGIQTFATSPSFANIDRSTMVTHIVAVGAAAGGGPEVRVFNFTTGKEMFDFFAYNANFTGGVRVAVADINGDGTPDIITAPGAGGGPNIRIFDGKTGAMISSFWAYNPSFAGGVFLAAGDVNGDGTPDIITGPGAGGGPNVRVFDGKTGTMIGNFMAYGSTFTGGVSVAAGDFNQDGKADIVTGAGPGGGPHVVIFNSATLTPNTTPAVLRQFFAFNPSYTGGVNVAANAFGQGDITGDGKTDLVVGTASGTGVVEVIDGSTFSVVSGFQAYDASMTNMGVHLSVFDLNGDGRADVVAGSGGGEGAFVRVVNVATDQDLEFFQAFNPAFLGGVWVGSA